MNAKRVALRVLLTSVVIASLIAIIGIVGEGFGSFGIKALSVALVVAGGCVLVLGCVGAWELPAARVPSRLGVIASCASMVVMIPGVCIEPTADESWQLAGSLCLVAIAATHASMMSLARLGPRAQWIRSAALAGNVLIVAMSLAAIWQVTRSSDVAEILAILAIIEAGLTLAITALSAVSRGTAAGERVGDICFCPRCGKRLWLPAGEIRCRHCDEVFFVELRPAGELPSAVVRG